MKQLLFRLLGIPFPQATAESHAVAMLKDRECRAEQQAEDALSSVRSVRQAIDPHCSVLSDDIRLKALQANLQQQRLYVETLKVSLSGQKKH